MKSPQTHTWTVGTELPTLTLRVTREQLIAYAAASGDHNRIHWDEDTARAVGLDGVIAHGMYTMGAAVAAVEAVLPAGARIVAYTTKFSAPVVVPARGAVEVLVTPTVASFHEDDRVVVFTLTATCAGAKVLGLTRVTVHLPADGTPG